MAKLVKKLTLGALVILFLFSTFFNISLEANEVKEIKMGYNGPADSEINPVHAYAVRFKEIVERGTNGSIVIKLYSDSKLGTEKERMDKTKNETMINIASDAGMVSVYPEIYAATLPFLFDSYQAAHSFFDDSQYWNKTKTDFRQKTGMVLLEAVEEGGFLTFTNSKKEIKSPADFSGLKFRAMDEAQKALFESFGASAEKIEWTQVYEALEEGRVDGQMNPTTYIISDKLYQVQDYMTLARIQYSCQWLTINGEWFNSLNKSEKYIIKKAARASGIINRIKVEAKVANRIQILQDKGMKIYKPNRNELNEFKEKGQTAYLSWLEDKISQKWIDLALDSAREANNPPYLRNEIPEYLQGFKSTVRRQVKRYPDNFYLSAITDEKVIALTFDDGPDKINTSKVLDILKEKETKATFFVEGEKAEKYPELTQRIVKEGHQIANHSWSHSDFRELSVEKILEEELVPTSRIISDYTSHKSKFIRPPYGAVTDEDIEYLANKGWNIVNWSIDTFDWDPENNAPDKIINKVHEYHHPGAIVLMHVGEKRGKTVEALTDIIDFLRSKGYKFMTVEEILDIF